MAKFDPSKVSIDEKCPKCSGQNRHSKNQRKACKGTSQQSASPSNR